VSYDAVSDFSPISLIAREVSVVAVHPSVPVKSIKELIALAKARPGQLTFSSATPGGASHLAGELFKHMAGINIVWVPYKGNAPAIAALLSGEVQLTIIDAGQMAPHVKVGKLRALAVTSSEPSALVPGLPTVSASGLPGYEAIGMTGLWAPVKTPGAIITRLNQEIVRVLKLPEVKEQLTNAGEEIVGSSPEQFASTIKSDIAKWGNLIKSIGIKAQ
jgi:tripartite-type tricarboxylate transporter receptor subunit TctC